MYPHGRIRGVVVKNELKDETGVDACKVFWYTTQSYQVIRTENLMLMQDALDEELKQMKEKNGE
ncbi:MAG: hypothetical protein ACYTGS_10210 [Planctomycetota bacterium]|jgi:hypothetical protein